MDRRFHIGTQFHDIFELCYQDVVSYAQVRILSGLEAEDVAASAFLILWRKKQSSTMCLSEVYCFLYKSVDYLIMNVKKKRSRHAEVSLNHLRELLERNQAFDEAFDKLLYGQYWAFLEKELNHNDWITLQLCEDQDTIPDKVLAIQEHWHLSDTAAYMRFFRLREKVRRLLRNEFDLKL